MSVFTLIDAQDQRELNKGALQRYLAEAVCSQTGLLPRQGVIWTAQGDNKAKATITDPGIIASLEFKINDAGEIFAVYTPLRYR